MKKRLKLSPTCESLVAFWKKEIAQWRESAKQNFFFFTIQGVVTTKNRNQSYMNESAKLLLGSVMEIMKNILM